MELKMYTYSYFNTTVAHILANYNNVFSMMLLVIFVAICHLGILI